MDQEEKSLTIGKIAKATALGVETIRFYEREGLIPKPPRKPSGYREYPLEIINRILFIGRAKELGFTLKEIKGFFSLRVDPRKTCADVRQLAEFKMKDVAEKIRQLRSIQGALQKLLKQCKGKGPTSQCPILENFRQESPTTCFRAEGPLRGRNRWWGRRKP